MSDLLKKYQVLIYSGLAGVLFWVFDTVLDVLFYYPGTFLELLILNPPAHEVYVRAAVLILFIGSGILINKTILQSKKTSIQHQILLENFPNGAVLLFDRNLRYQFAEGAGLEAAGLNKTELVGAKVSEVFSGETLESILPAYQAALDGKPTDAVVPFGDRTYRMHTIPVPDQYGTIQSGMVMTQDITTDIEHLKSLQKSEQQFREFLEKVNFIAVILDTGGRILFCNDTLLEISGWTRPEILGQSWFELFIPPEAKAQLKEEVFLDAIQSGEVKTHHINQILTKAGTRRLINWNNIIYRGISGKVTGTASLGLDITEQENFRRELNAFFEMSLDLICIADLENFQFLEINPSFERVLGYTRQDLLEKPFLEFVHPEDREATIAAVEEELKAGKKLFSFVNRYRLQDGSYRWLDWVSYPVPEEGITYAVARDITERRVREAELEKYRLHLEELVDTRTEQLQERVEQVEKLNRGMLNLSEDLQKSNQQLSQAAGELSAANEELESFAYSVSHDLRAPLRGISGFAQILAERHRETLNSEGREYLDYILQAGERMNELINDLLQYARLGRKAVRRVPVDCQSILDQVYSDLDQKITRSGAVIQLEKDLPSSFFSDQTILKQILLNLVDNALTYQKSGTVPEIQIRCRTENHDLILEIEDNGLGIPAEHQEKIFDVFQRLHSAEEYPGTGIGLALVRKGVKMLGGNISLTSAPGQGSTFIIHLPLTEKEDNYDQ
jgi:PAS domain S-box-containing protein